MARSEADDPQFYFALPRLIAALRHRNAARTETNWLEANVAGAAVMLVSYLALDRLCLGGAAFPRQLLFLLPLVLLTWIFWIIALYVNAQIIKLFRSFGMPAAVSNARAQSLLIAIITTGFACQLAGDPSWRRGIGITWITAVVVNLISAGCLAVSSRQNAR